MGLQLLQHSPNESVCSALPGTLSVDNQYFATNARAHLLIFFTQSELNKQAYTSVLHRTWLQFKVSKLSLKWEDLSASHRRISIPATSPHIVEMFFTANWLWKGGCLSWRNCPDFFDQISPVIVCKFLLSGCQRGVTQPLYYSQTAHRPH